MPWIICVILYIFWPSLWSSGQSSCLQIQRSKFESQRYQIFWEVVALERGPLSLVSAIEELRERKSSVSSLENQDYGCRRSAALTTLHPLSAKVGTNFANKWWSFNRYSSLMDWGDRVTLIITVHLFTLMQLSFIIDCSSHSCHYWIMAVFLYWKSICFAV
jgi:hypothetical protein